MSLQLEYISLFEIQILHHYFLDLGTSSFAAMNSDEQLARLQQYDVRSFLEIKPTKSCLQALKDHQLLWRPSHTGLLIGAKRNPDASNRPAVPISSDLRLTFGLSFLDGLFLNYSDLPLEPNRRQRYYFTNEGASASGSGILNLSSAADSPAGARFMGADDLFRFQSPFYDFDLADEDTIATAQLSDVTDAGNTAIFRQVFNEDADNRHDHHQLDLRRLSAGPYRLRITNNADDSLLLEDAFYLDNEQYSRQFSALIDIRCLNATANDFAILQTSGILKATPRRFVIRINNRSTIWRYIFKEEKTVGADDDLVIENAGTDNVLVTPTSQPLTSDGFIELNMDNQPLPNPSPRIIKPDGGSVYSEIYL